MISLLSQKPIVAFSLATLVVVSAAPALYGCQPPWASGFLLATVLLLAAFRLVALSADSGLSPHGLRTVPPGGSSRAAGPLAPWALSGALLVWLGALVAVACWQGQAGGQSPSLSLLQLCYAGAFLGAAVLGAAGSAARTQFRLVSNGLFLVGVALAMLGLLHLLGWSITEHVEFSGRLSAFASPNRFAVLLTVCWACGVAAIAADWQNLRAGEAAGGTRIAVKTGAAIFVLVCIILTLSRLALSSICVVTVFFGLAWVQLRNLETPRLSIPAVSAVERMAQWAHRLMPVFGLILVFGICFAIGQNALRFRAMRLAETGFGERWQGWVAAWPLLCQHPLVGQGLGAFESRFTAVQPIGLEGRWRELHSDWLQLAVEAGLPALVLALALTAAWWHSIWRLLKADYQVSRLWALERGLPVAGIVVALLCSAADFPLREPATAILVFFLAGAVCQTWPDAVAESGARKPGGVESPSGQRFGPLWLQRGGALLLALLFVGGALVLGRNALAYSRSPWLWHLSCPSYTPATADAWRAALAVDPGDPHIRFALSASLFKAGTPDALDQARANLKAACEMLPDDYKAYALAALVEQKAGHHDQAIALVEEAVRRAPGNRELRQLAGGLYLKGLPRGAIGEQRDAIVDTALGHFQAVMAVADPAQMISELKARGCMVDEIGRLWPGQDAASRLRRAEFFLEEDQLHLVDRELKPPPPSEPDDLSRYHLLLGALCFRRGDNEPAVDEWGLALDCAPFKVLAQRGNWMAGHLPPLNGPLAERLATRIEAHLPQLPVLNDALMWALVRGKKCPVADRLLAKTAYQSPSLYAAWAEAALGMSDFEMAKARAEAALQRGPGDWRGWHREFMERLNAQRQPR